MNDEAVPHPLDALKELQQMGVILDERGIPVENAPLVTSPSQGKDELGKPGEAGDKQ